MDEQEHSSDSLQIRLIEAFDGRIRCDFDDGVYFHSGDFLEFLQRDADCFGELADFHSQEVIENLMLRFQAMIVNRSGGLI